MNVKKWEYRIVWWSLNTRIVAYDQGGDLDIEDTEYFRGEWSELELLDHLGGEGWELVSVPSGSRNYIEYYLKRPASED